MKGFWRIVNVPAFDELPPKEQDKAYKYVALCVLRRWQFWASFLNLNACLVGGLYVGSLFGSDESGDVTRLISELICLAIGAVIGALPITLAAIKYAHLHAPEYMEKRKATGD